jgi:glycosyltransferase involved in cell wall biosynthesis
VADYDRNSMGLKKSKTKYTSLSIVIPAYNEEESLGYVLTDTLKDLPKAVISYEIIVVDDGSTDKTYSKLKKLHRKDKRVKIIRLRGTFGKSVALQVGFDHAKKDIIFTLDADLQDNPKEIPNFLKKIEQGYDLVSGWKRERHDPQLKKVIPS